MTNRRIGAVIVAAGRGERAGQSVEGPKQYRKIGGEPVILRTLRCFLEHPLISSISVAIHPEDRELFHRAVGDLAGHVQVVSGGASRQASTRLALLALRGHDLEGVLIHDGVRPFVSADLITRVCEDLSVGALPAIPVSDTIKRADLSKTVTATVPRADLFSAQTPQGFPFKRILAAHVQAFQDGLDEFTDDAALAEWAGIPVKLVEGSPDNVKLTWAKDIEMANARLTDFHFPDVRTGNGYDVHTFGEGDHVMLCGVAIPFGKALTGHSDADVGLHALTDALLATSGAGDIGTHFPPSDMKWKGAASRIFVEEAVRIVRARGGRIANADITLIAEAPKIGPNREAMTKELADMLGISGERVSVKATTNERMGFVGREEGIAAIATATVVYPGEIPE